MAKTTQTQRETTCQIRLNHFVVSDSQKSTPNREALEALHGQVWSTEELQQDFEALGFMAPFIVIRRRSDGVKGSLEFQHDPRLYFNFQPE